ncbi:MAG TPA: helix-turn-helix transcriptional regulator [Polyangiaceae bacterium]
MLAGRRAQVWRHEPAFRRPRHFHREPEINLLVRGRCVLGIGDRSVSLSRGQSLFFEPGQDHELLEASDDLELFVLALSPELAERAFGARPSCSIPEGDPPRMVSSMHAELAGLAHVSDVATAERRLAELFVRAVDGAPKAHVRSHRALASLRVERDVSEATLARRLGVDPSELSRRFRADLGVTLVEYRARLRLMRFVELVDRGISMTRAALDADFGSYAQCHRVFRRVFGCAPTDYFQGARHELDWATV